MGSVSLLVKTHRAALILAALASIIVSFPQLYFRIEHTRDGIYQGIELLPDSPWSARIREVQDGHPTLGSIYYADGKDDPYLFQPFGSMIVGYLGSALGLDINNTILLSRLLLPFIAFLFMYAFVFLLSRDKLAALVSASILVFADSLLSVFGITQLLSGLPPDNFLRIARPLNPAMIYIFLFGFLTAFWKFCQTKDWRWGAGSALLLGLNFYAYFYSWTYLYAFGGLFGVFLLIQKKWKEALQVTAVYVGALVVAIPYAINLYRASFHPTYEEASVRFGIVATHEPLFVGFLVIGALLLFFLAFPRTDRTRYAFSLALLLAPFITMNQQLFTGKVLQASHYHWFFHKPAAVIFAVIILFMLLARRWQSYRTLLAVVAIGGCVAAGAFVQTSSYVHDERDGGAIAIERQEYGPVMRWLTANAQKEDVVLANTEASHLVVVYTPLNVFHHHAAMYSLAATRERLLDALFAHYRLRGVEEDAREVLYAERGHVSASIYGMHYRELSGSYESVPDEKIEEIVALYQETLRTPDREWLQHTLSRYTVSYIIWDTEKDPAWRLEQYPFLSKAQEFGSIAVYRYTPSGP